MFLSSIQPLLRGSADITLRISAAKGGGMAVLVLPTLEQMEPETGDQVVAQLQQALVRPLSLTIPAGEDPDAALAAILTQVDAARTPLIDQLASYREQVAEAANQARLAADKKGAAGKAAPAGKGKVAGTATTGRAAAKDAPSETVSTDAPAHAPAPAPEADAVEGAEQGTPAAAADLFAD